MPREVPHTLTATDGRTLAARLYVPDGPPRASVALLGAYAVKQRYYRRFATWLAERGFLVLTFDMRGIGDSLVGHVRDERVTTTDWALLDHGAALAWLAAQDGPRLAVGHSFGGQIVGLNEAAACIDALYGVACQLGYWGHFDGLARWRMRLLFSTVMPGLTRLYGYLPAWTGIGEDVPAGAMLEWLSWLRSPGYLLDHVPDAAARLQRWPGFFESIGFTDDGYAPPRGVQALAACFSPERTRLRILAPSDVGLQKIDHFGFFRPHTGDVLWQDALSFLETWAAPSRHAGEQRA